MYIIYNKLLNYNGDKRKGYEKGVVDRHCIVGIDRQNEYFRSWSGSAGAV